MSSDVGYGKPPIQHQFKPGRSGNPGGRPKGLERKIREALGEDGDMLVEFWVNALRTGYIANRHPTTGELVYEKVSARDQIAIATVLADRGWGKAPAHVTLEDDADRAERARWEQESWQRFAEALQREMDRMDQIKERRRREKEEQAHRTEGAARNGDDNPPSAAN